MPNTPWVGLATRPPAQIGALAGNLRQELLLDAHDPRTFVIVTEWADESALRDYENGPVAAASPRPCGRCASHPSRRRPAGDARPAPASGSTIFVDVEMTVPAARLAEFERGYAEVAARMAGVPGYLREDLLREPGTDIYHIFAEWRSEAEFYRWIGNPAHAQEEAGPIAPFLLDFRRRLFHLAAHPGTDQARTDYGQGDRRAHDNGRTHRRGGAHRADRRRRAGPARHRLPGDREAGHPARATPTRRSACTAARWRSGRSRASCGRRWTPEAG